MSDECKYTRFSGLITHHSSLSTHHFPLIKTVSEKYSEIETAIQSQHSYENPKIIALPVEFIATNYLSWLREAVHS